MRASEPSATVPKLVMKVSRHVKYVVRQLSLYSHLMFIPVRNTQYAMTEIIILAAGVQLLILSFASPQCLLLPRSTADEKVE